MLPGLNNGSLVLVYKYKFPKKYFINSNIHIFDTLDIKRMDIVLFETEDGRLLIKRVVGKPGDFFVFKHGSILIDTIPLKEFNANAPSNKPVIVPIGESQTIHYSLQNDGRIPPGYYLLLGDNRENSYDSRELGLIPEERLRGKVVSILKE
jgi:signal peptidase I